MEELHRYKYLILEKVDRNIKGRYNIQIIDICVKVFMSLRVIRLYT